MKRLFELIDDIASRSTVDRCQLHAMADHLFEVLLIGPDWPDVAAMMRLQGYEPNDDYRVLYGLLSSEAINRRLAREAGRVPPSNPSG